MRPILAGICLPLLLLASPLAAQEPEMATRVAGAGAARPAADIEDLAWLAGSWEGPGIEGAPAQESYAPPLGGTIAGTFVQQDGEGGVMFYEFIQIAKDGDSLVLRLKHFDPDMTGWEEPKDFVSFPLIAREGDIWYFDGLTFDRQAPDRLRISVRMHHSDGSVSELAFPLARAAGREDPPSCPDAITTIDMNQCLAGIAGAREERLQHYLSAALDRNADNPDVAAAIQASQQAFEAYREGECGAVYEDWKGGTIRNAMALGCRIRLTDERTHTVWRNWLTYMDSTPPMLPEPGPTG